MKNGKFLLGMLVGAAAAFVVSGVLNVGVRAAGDQQAAGDTNADRATAPFLFKMTNGATIVIDDRNAVDCPANGAVHFATPNGDIELDLGLIHYSIPYALENKKIPVMRISTRVIMNLKGAKNIESSLQSAIEDVERNTKQSATTRPNGDL